MPPSPSVSCHELPSSSFFYSSSSLTSCFCLLLLSLSLEGGGSPLSSICEHMTEKRGEQSDEVIFTSHTWHYRQYLTILDDNTWWQYLIWQYLKILGEKRSWQWESIQMRWSDWSDQRRRSPTEGHRLALTPTSSIIISSQFLLRTFLFQIWRKTSDTLSAISWWQLSIFIGGSTAKATYGSISSGRFGPSSSRTRARAV